MNDRTKYNRRHNQKKKNLIDRLKNVPCCDCSKTFPVYVMEFDHLYGKKKYTIAALISKLGIKKLQEELKKCEVVCANCHSIRTFKRRIKNKLK